MVLRQLQPSFTGGEISPSLQARTDAGAYHTWLKSAQNMLIHPQGGISNRPGTQYQGAAKYAAKNCRLFAFPISEEESYIVEAGEQYLRFYTSNGPVLAANQSMLEIATPYSAQDVEKLHTAQYNNSLYISHPSYPLRRLTRTALGQFTWEEVPLTGGPFQPANTDETKKMRLYPQTQTVESQGVAATLAFEPVNYPNLIVWAYFNGEWFYAADGYGLRLSEIAQYFNDQYASQGLTATVQGSILRVTSAAADGGDWNDATLVLEYRSSFSGPANETVTQTLSGGENAGTQTVVQAGRYVLESDFDMFTPLHTGALFSLTHVVDAQQLQGTLGYESVSSFIKSGSDWTLRTGGTWTGTLHVEVSRDGGSTWNTLKVLTRASGEDNFYLAGNLNDPETMFCLRVRSCQISGEATYELTADAFIQQGVVQVFSYVSARQVIVSAQRAFGSEAWTDNWAQGSFSPAAGYPACVFFYQDRLGLAATAREMQTLWFSKTGKPADFGHARDTFLSTDGFSVRLGGTRLNRIEHVLVANRLLVFTAGSEWTLTSNGGLSLDTLQLERQSEYGTCAVGPVLVGNRVLFVSSGGAAVREWVYDYTTCSYTGQDVTLRAKHLFAGQTLTQLAFTHEPDPVLWCVTQSGDLRTLTYIPDGNIYAWTHQQTQGEWVSVCELNGTVWLAVRRKGGIFIEKMLPRPTDTDPCSPVFLDSSVSYVFDTAQTELTGLSHLEGQKINVLADGNVCHGLTVTGGKVTLPFAVQRAHAGLAYQSEITTLPLAQAQGEKHRLVSVGVCVLNSRGGKIGTEKNALTPLVQRTHEAYNAPIALQTRVFEVALADRHQTAPSLVVRQEEPLPLTVLALRVRAA